MYFLFKTCKIICVGSLVLVVINLSQSQTAYATLNSLGTEYLDSHSQLTADLEEQSSLLEEALTRENDDLKKKYLHEHNYCIPVNYSRTFAHHN